jgi:hypothetical protein
MPSTITVTDFVTKKPVTVTVGYDLKLTFSTGTSPEFEEWVRATFDRQVESRLQAGTPEWGHAVACLAELTGGTPHYVPPTKEEYDDDGDDGREHIY